MEMEGRNETDGREGSQRKYRYGYLAVETSALFFMLGQYLSFPTNTSLLYRKSCLEHFNSSFCDDMENKTFQEDHKDEQDMIQTTASMWMRNTLVAVSVPSIVIVFFFIGTWGDKVDRKVAILLPFMGSLLNNIINMLNAMYMDWPIEYLVIGPVVNGILGNYSTALMGLYSYVAHTSPPKQKTIRIGIMEALTFLSGSIAVFVSGLILKAIGFTGVFIAILSCQGFAILYCLIFVKSIKPTPKKTEEKTEKWVDFWIMNTVRDTMTFIRKKRPGRTRFYIWMYVLLINLVLLGTLGELDLLYLFLRRTPRAFNRTQYGYFRGSENFCRSLALFTLLPFMKKVLQMPDTTLIMMGVLFKSIGFVFLGIATTMEAVFCTLIFAVLHGLPAAAIRSGLATMVDENEIGRVFALVSSTESLLSLIATFIFNNIYPLTLDFFPGLLFECSAVLCFGILVITTYLHLDMKKNGQNGDAQPMTDEVRCQQWHPMRSEDNAEESMTMEDLKGRNVPTQVE